jgi:hypothetical protein
MFKPTVVRGYGEMVMFNTVPREATHVVLTEGNRIDTAALQARYNLVSITLPPSMRVIGFHAFNNCVNLTTIKIPEGVTTIHAGAFRGCISLVSVELPSTLWFLGYCAFFKCSALVRIRLPPMLKIINAYTFWGCTNLQEVVLPTHLERINNCAFEKCGLTSISVPHATRCIEAHAFKKCEALTKIRIKSSLTSLSTDAVRGCDNLLVAEFNEVQSGKIIFGECRNLSVVVVPAIDNNIRTRFDGCNQRCTFTTNSLEANLYRWWTPATHCVSTPAIKLLVETLLLVAHRISGSTHKLPGLPALMWRDVATIAVGPRWKS